MTAQESYWEKRADARMDEEIDIDLFDEEDSFTGHYLSAGELEDWEENEFLLKERLLTLAELMRR